MSVSVCVSVCVCVCMRQFNRFMEVLLARTQTPTNKSTHTPHTYARTYAREDRETFIRSKLTETFKFIPLSVSDIKCRGVIEVILNDIVKWQPLADNVVKQTRDLQAGRKSASLQHGCQPTDRKSAYQ